MWHNACGKDERISLSDYSKLSRSISLLIDMGCQLDEGQQFHGIIHADTHKGNMLYHERRDLTELTFPFVHLGIICSIWAYVLVI